MDERRRFERVNIPPTAKVYATDASGKRLGQIRVLGRGGILVDSKATLPASSADKIVLVDQSEGIQRQVQVRELYRNETGVGYEFVNLEPDAAVEIGVIIGKYYSAAAH